MCVCYVPNIQPRVAPLAGSVDRNGICGGLLGVRGGVAPLAGSVDRNANAGNIEKLVGSVAPLAGSVDRNCLPNGFQRGSAVAPLAGSVDRNKMGEFVGLVNVRRSPRGERG